MGVNLKDVAMNILRPVTSLLEPEEDEKKQDIRRTMNNVWAMDDNESDNSNLHFPSAPYESKVKESPFTSLLSNPNQVTKETIKNKALEYLSLSPKGGAETTSTDTTITPVSFNSNLDSNSLSSLDVSSELPKLTEEQISSIISKHFSKSTVISPSDAKGIFEAQQKSGMSALAILGIGALESGYGTSNIAKQKNNLWGWNATNVNPTGNAKTFSPVSQGALEFANSYMKTYYNGYGAKSIYSAGTGDNPSGKGYAYLNDGSIEKAWATKVGNIMGAFYDTAKTTSNNALDDGVSSVASALTTAANNKKTASTSTGSSGYANKVGTKVANTSSYQNSASKGQCVWYVRGRMKEKLGKDTGAIGNGNQMWHNAKPAAKVAAKTENLKPNMIVSYQKGTSSAGQTYGHVIYIEDVVGDTVYYTEGGSGYHASGKDGVVKTATRKGILEGANTSGGRMGSGVIGFIDLSKY